MSFSAPRSDEPARPDAGEGDVVGPEIRRAFDLSRPQEPTAGEWDRVNRAVAQSLPRPGPSWRTVAASLAAGVVLAVGAIALWPTRHIPSPGPELARDRASDPPDEIVVLPTATEDDVEIHGLRGGGWKATVVGRSPIADEIAWAGPNDVRIKSSTPDEFFGSEPKMSGGNQNMPVIWANDSQR